MENKIYNTDELTHHGIKGQKWGIRRFQNKDGSLTAAGHKRRAKLEGELEKLGGKKSSNSEDAPKKKSVAEMTDEELRAHTNRMMLETSYYNANRNLAMANPKQVSKGRKFMDSFVNDVVGPAAKNAGKAWLEKFMKDKLGLSEQKQKSIDEKLKEFDLKTRQKNEELDDVRRQIAIIEAQRRLKSERERDET